MTKSRPKGACKGLKQRSMPEYQIRSWPTAEAQAAGPSSGCRRPPAARRGATKRQQVRTVTRTVEATRELREPLPLSSRHSAGWPRGSEPRSIPSKTPGGVPERLNGAVSKTVVGVTPLPRVRISPPPLEVGKVRERGPFPFCRRSPGRQARVLVDRPAFGHHAPHRRRPGGRRPRRARRRCTGPAIQRSASIPSPSSATRQAIGPAAVACTNGRRRGAQVRPRGAALRPIAR